MLCTFVEISLIYVANDHIHRVGVITIMCDGELWIKTIVNWAYGIDT